MELPEIMMTIVFVALILVSFILFIAPTTIQETDCYDRHNNVIEGVSCKEEVMDKGYEQIVIVILCISLTAIIGLLLYALKEMS